MVVRLNTPPARLGATRAGETDTRGLDLTAVMTPVGDTIASITSITRARVIAATLVTGDLAITPAGAPSPWISAIPYGPPDATGLIVNWWQSSGSTIANAAAIDYKITITVVTAGGRVIVHDCYQLVVAGLG